MTLSGEGVAGAESGWLGGKGSVGESGGSECSDEVGTWLETAPLVVTESLDGLVAFVGVVTIPAGADCVCSNLGAAGFNPRTSPTDTGFLAGCLGVAVADESSPLPLLLLPVLVRDPFECVSRSFVGVAPPPPAVVGDDEP